MTHLVAAALLSSLALAGDVEAVRVITVADDTAIVARSSGAQHLLELGIGCLGISRWEGRTAYVHSSGLFAGVGSRLVVPENGWDCPIWDSSSVSFRSGAPPTTSPAVQATCADLNYVLIRLGFHPAGSVPSSCTTDTVRGLARAQEAMGYPATGQADDASLAALALAVISGPGATMDDLLVAQRLAGRAPTQPSRPVQGSSSYTYRVESVINNEKFQISGTDGRFLCDAMPLCFGLAPGMTIRFPYSAYIAAGTEVSYGASTCMVYSCRNAN